ncbi:GIY-YIG nuclease family protein [Actinomyces sp. Z5]|uniref:GIY-YIG nuclease family protein n=1 Tax=Actinomyces sp. Z5 TaxID=2250216 RepID=UPI000DCF3E16|nr:GIY-YIG nuclease family protein [Actinomyces sp. Z5]RAX22112.1 GIY-YIG nuclease family protein [Actinomyces sp. Z5]
MSEQPPIKFFELLGIPKDELSRYSVRLNSNRGFSIPVIEAYYQEPEKLMQHISKRRWAGDGKSAKNINGERVIQFIQLDDGHRDLWLFIGVFVRGDLYSSGGDELYRLDPDPRFTPLAARLVARYRRKRGYMGIDFDLSKATHLEGFTETMTVVRIADSPVSAMPFPGYDRVRLSHAQLRAAVRDESWRAALGSIQAVYLQTDTRNGWHYVGSAYSRHGGDRGLLSRWSEYACGDHSGGNKRLRELSPEYIEQNFQYSILEIFDMHATAKDIIHREHWWMDTLGSVYYPDSRSPHGYNSVPEREREEVD